ncbi:Multidrug ABC transporter ATPase [Candidatus Hydrogenisulfobacillus filiaventi]|uniref:Multidrug ABC transporter ATPase n=1 Tax=Candidatus Hydrogenisulfobacillus filiaventi TaxID=2707344 RepID=A0A6F8ZHP8_9FIRM|nr:Multidrug ABC transporter ATPase [Candidatus Hydrogenisulfobacillus filiaventi]
MGMHGPLHALWQQQQAREYLKNGRPAWGPVTRRAAGLFRPYRAAVAGGLGLAALTVGLGLVPPLLIRRILDRSLPAHDIHAILVLSALMVAVTAAQAVAGWAEHYLAAVVAQGVILSLRRQLFAHLEAMGLAFFVGRRGGNLHSRFVNDLGSLQNVLAQALLGTVQNVLTVGLTLTVMFVLNWRLTLAATAALPAFALPVIYFGRRRYEAVRETQEALERMTGVLEEALALPGILAVKGFGAEARELARFSAEAEAVRRAQVRQTAVTQWMMVIIQSLAALGPGLLFGYGAFLIIRHQVQLGTVVAFATYLLRLYAPASSLAGTNATLLGAVALFERIFAFLDLPVEVADPPRPRPLPAVPRDGLCFEGVSFRYPGSATDALQEVSFCVRPGSMVALVGPSGAGKSTILALAARFYDPTGGTVRLEGLDLREVAQADLRRRLALVTQEPVLFHATLLENLLYGRPDADARAVEEAVEAAQLTELVARLPDGLHTLVGEHGYRLSGGEKQRLAIARAILRQPAYLLLDEATSALDSHAERLIQAALERLVAGRTVIAIAHRLSTVLRAATILVVDHGRIVERGTHQALLARGGLYRLLYTEQFAAGAAGLHLAAEEAKA